MSPLTRHHEFVFGQPPQSVIVPDAELKGKIDESDFYDTTDDND